METGQFRPINATSYLAGQASIAIWAVSRGIKPLADIGVPHGLDETLKEINAEAALMGVSWLPRVDEQETIVYFYRELWVADAIRFINNAGLSYRDRSWIQGLLYGIRPDLIQKFFDQPDLSNG
ncbi:MAG TPA: hypothetical protein VG941_00625 [Candidatus Paceibacterota bacterium]|nr:hypothetical protein [Candidatus Paceibacterota bacterium]